MANLGIAAAIHGFDPLRLATTVVEGERKDDIRIRETQSHELDVVSVDSVRRAFGGLVETMVQSVRVQVEGVGQPLPMVLGVPTNYDMTTLLQTMRAAFPGFALSTGKDRGERRRMDRKGQKLRKRTKSERGLDDYMPTGEDIAQMELNAQRMKLFLHGIGNFLYQNMDLAGLSRPGLLLNTRGFVNMAKEYEFDDERTRLFLEAKRDLEWERNFEIHKPKFTNHFEISERLVRLIWDRAMDFAASIRTQMGENPESRFMMLAPIHPLAREAVYFNFFKDDVRLRQMFVEMVSKILGWHHNVALKSMNDPSSPPFADVVATLVADQIDMAMYGEIRGTAVMIKH